MDDTTKIVIGGLTGGLAGAVLSQVVNWFTPFWRRRRLNAKLDLIPFKRAGTRGTARVHNSHVLPMSSVIAYISIQHELEDIVDPKQFYPNQHFDVFVSQGHQMIVKEDRLCWSSTAPISNPPAIDIYAGEMQSLDIVDIRDGKWIEIPSEKGWTTTQTDFGANDRRTSRVFLKPQKYRATIKLVSRETKAKTFDIEIDPADRGQPVKLRV